MSWKIAGFLRLSSLVREAGGRRPCERQGTPPANWRGRPRNGYSRRPDPRPVAGGTALALSHRLPPGQPRPASRRGKSANFLYLPVFTANFLAKNCKILLDMTAARFLYSLQKRKCHASDANIHQAGTRCLGAGTRRVVRKGLGKENVRFS